VHQNTLVAEAPLVAARAAGVPCVVYLRELPDQDSELCARLQIPPEALRESLIRQADRFIANSTATADWILAGSAQDSDSALAGRVTVLPNAIDAALFDLPFAPQTPLRVALVGSNTAKKGIADALLVARGCADLGVDVEVVLIGPETADLRALGPLPKNMRLAGYAPDPVAALAQVDVLLSLSHFSESFGRTVLEALAAGRPVIAYDRGTPPALIGSEGAGVVVPADDPQAVVAALQAILRTPTALPGLSNKARQRAREILALAENIPDSALFGPCRDQDC
jgi:glycosyltransferase involved in cell wall biosynthesis